MRALLLSSVFAFSPRLALADGMCAVPVAPPAAVAPAPPLVPVASPPSVPDAAPPSSALDHVAAAGARIEEAGTAHGLRTVNARNGDRFTRLYVAPGGGAVVAGSMAEMSVSDLRAMAGGRVVELGVLHGLPGFFVPNGDRFQVYYATPDMHRVIPGAMFDASGKSLTREQVASIPGAVPTVAVGDLAGGPPRFVSALEAAQATDHGTAGQASAPRLWVFVDPHCAPSIRAVQRLRPHVDAGRVQLAVVPVAVLDRGPGGRSARAAASLLSLPRGDLVSAWTDGRFGGPAGPEGEAGLARNAAVAGAIALKGTPTFVWRKADGTEGRADGLPDDVEALVASVGR